MNACRLLTKANVIAAVAAEKAKITDKIEVTQEDVLRMLKAEAEGKVDIPGSTMSQSARVTAISLLGKYHGMFIDNTNVNVTDLDSRMQRARDRMAAKRAVAGQEDTGPDETTKPSSNVIDGGFNTKAG